MFIMINDFFFFSFPILELTTVSNNKSFSSTDGSPNK